MGVSVAELYAACFGPGFLLAGIFIVYCLVRSIINPEPGAPIAARGANRELQAKSPSS